MRKTFGSLFSGGGGADIGAKAAGLELAWGVEYVPEIAEVANANLGQHIKVANILDCNPLDFERVDVLHASPPCPSFSVAKANGAETELDIALARKVAEFATVLQPQVFTLENVQAYQKSKSWRIIEGALYEAGYWLSVSIVNFADMGVAQTRKRMIVRAVRGSFVPYLPQPERWVGWYEAIEDIIDTLPDSRFADWQLARLPEEIKTLLIDSKNVNQEYGKLYRNANEPALTVTTDDRPSHMPRALLVAQGGYGHSIVTADDTDPAFTVTGNGNQTKVRALLVSNAKTEYSDGTRNSNDPAFTGNGESNGRVKAFLVGKHYDAPSSADIRHVQVKHINEPSMTVAASDKIECRAFLVGKNADKYGDGLRWWSEPAQTIGANEHGSKAFIVDCQKAGDTTGDRGVTIRNGDEPCFTLTSGTGQRRPARAYDGVGRVVAMTPRALARFQSFPDGYTLPDSKTLAAKIIGNAVPPLGYQKIIGGLL